MGTDDRTFQALWSQSQSRKAVPDHERPLPVAEFARANPYERATGLSKPGDSARGAQTTTG